MTLHIPGYLQWLEWVAGSEWPNGDEDRMWDLADDLQSAGDRLRDTLPDLDNAIDLALAAYSQGDGRTEMAESLRAMRSGEGSLEHLAQLYGDLSESAEGMGTEIQYAKFNMIASLIWLAAELAISKFCPFTSAAQDAASISYARLTIQGIRQWAAEAIRARLTRLFGARAAQFLMRTASTMAREAFSEMIEGLSQELAVQGLQVMGDHRDGFDWDALGMTAATAAFGGAVAAPVSDFVDNRLVGSALPNAIRGRIPGVASALVGAAAGWGATGVLTGSWDFDPRSLTSSVFGGGLSNAHGGGDNSGRSPAADGSVSHTAGGAPSSVGAVAPGTGSSRPGAQPHAPASSTTENQSGAGISAESRAQATASGESRSSAPGESRSSAPGESHSSTSGESHSSTSSNSQSSTSSDSRSSTSSAAAAGEARAHASAGSIGDSQSSASTGAAQAESKPHSSVTAATGETRAHASAAPTSEGRSPTSTGTTSGDARSATSTTDSRSQASTTPADAARKPVGPTPSRAGVADTVQPGSGREGAVRANTADGTARPAARSGSATTDGPATASNPPPTSRAQLAEQGLPMGADPKQTGPDNNDRAADDPVGAKTDPALDDPAPKEIPPRRNNCAWEALHIVTELVGDRVVRIPDADGGLDGMSATELESAAGASLTELHSRDVMADQLRQLGDGATALLVEEYSGLTDEYGVGAHAFVMTNSDGLITVHDPNADGGRPYKGGEVSPNLRGLYGITYDADGVPVHPVTTDSGQRVGSNIGSDSDGTSDTGTHDGEVDPTLPESAAVHAFIAQALAGHPELESVVHAIVDDTAHPLELTHALADPGRRDTALGILSELAEMRLLGDRSLAEYIAEHPGRGPLFDPIPPEINHLPNGQSRLHDFVDNSTLHDPARAVGRDPDPRQRAVVAEYARRLVTHVEPVVRAELARLAEDFDGASTSMRTKSGVGILEKVGRLVAGSETRPPRPNYRVGDVIDAVGARITVADTRQLSRLLEHVQRQFGVGDGGRLLEIENMYAGPKSAYPEYRVITMVVRVDADGIPYTYELQLTTLRSSVGADLQHNTLHKPLVDITPQQRDMIRRVWSEASALDQHETRTRRTRERTDPDAPTG